MRKRLPHRRGRVAALVQQELADAVVTRVKDPRVGFVTVTSVEVTTDLSYATVRVSVLGSEDDKRGAIEGLVSARGFLRSHLAHTLALRATPELRFVLDRGLDHAARIAQLLSHEDNAGAES